MAGPVIPFGLTLLRMGGRAKVLEKLKKGMGAFESLNKLIDKREGKTGEIVIPNFRQRSLQRDAARADERRSAMTAQEDEKAEKLKDITDKLAAGGFNDPNKTPEQEDEEPEKARGGLSKGVFDDAVKDTAGNIKEGTVTPEEIKAVEQRRAIAERFIAARQKPGEVGPEGVGPLRQAELMASRTGIRAVNPDVAPGTGFVFENLANNDGTTMGRITTNPISGRTEVMIVAKDPQTGETTAIGIPFSDRVDAFHAIEEFFDNGPPSLAALIAIEELMMQILGVTDIDEFMKQDK